MIIIWIYIALSKALRMLYIEPIAKPISQLPWGRLMAAWQPV